MNKHEFILLLYMRIECDMCRSKSSWFARLKQEVVYVCAWQNRYLIDCPPSCFSSTSCWNKVVYTDYAMLLVPLARSICITRSEAGFLSTWICCVWATIISIACSACSFFYCLACWRNAFALFNLIMNGGWLCTIDLIGSLGWSRVYISLSLSW